jgi:UDP-N-acetylglucosamine diphosphorylase / glucose-1-phosphate thymidylyltransferase / UDP-N-acetylgalactosamine diphosphorylase / glucosamine-1-phosphate N-acetyltransferase / galactosamine-1-phosphate N-acetyltransferase
MLQRAILLAAGRGTRLGALTAARPKPMVLVQGKPVLEHILLRLQQAGLTEFILVVGYRADVVQEYFGDGTRWGWRISYTFQPQPNGTGAALAQASDLAGSEPFLASYGDILTDEANYRRLQDEYLAAPCAALVGVNWQSDVSAGAAVYRESNRVIKVVEKPPPGTADSHWNLAGVSIYSSAIWTALATLQPSARGEYELTDAINSLITSGQEVRACEFSGFWSDIGTPQALRNVEQKLRQG